MELIFFLSLGTKNASNKNNLRKKKASQVFAYKKKSQHAHHASSSFSFYMKG
jgi:hypothetical protein